MLCQAEENTSTDSTHSKNHDSEKELKRQGFSFISKNRYALEEDGVGAGYLQAFHEHFRIYKSFIISGENHFCFYQLSSNTMAES